MTIPTVYILATCRKPELLEATKLVFKTLRLGFPTASITVHGNALNVEHDELLKQITEDEGGVYHRLESLDVHQNWIRRLIETRHQPFFILDTDVVFFDSFEKFEMKGPIAGRLIPRFFNKFTGAITHARLHTALMYIEPVPVRLGMERRLSELNHESPFGDAAKVNLIEQNSYLLYRRWHFHDTMSQVYHAIGGTRFTPEMMDAYTHMNCGTYLDIAKKRIPDLSARAEAILKDPAAFRGDWRKEDNYYERNAA